MKHWVWLIPMVAACATDDLSSIEQNAGDYQAGDYQAGDYQAGDYQAGDYQAGDYQGTHYDSTSASGGTQNGVTLGAASVSGTALVVWKRRGLTLNWEQRFPDKICYWNSTKTTSTGCTSVDLSTQPSPLAGMRFPTTMRTGPTTTMQGWVQIGTSSSDVGAVSKDQSYAMWNLAGFGTGSTLTHVTTKCVPWKAGCRKNDDLWVYDLRLVNADGSLLQFCSSNQSYALAGTWDRAGSFSLSRGEFTFACSTGTIAKCTRWGYRNWVTTATRSDGAANIALAPYHQACVRAAMADYCANGHTFTKFHTLVDIYDTNGGPGFIQSVNAFPEESGWDAYGAYYVDHYRYQELAGTQSYGSITDATVGCPDRFQDNTGDGDDVTPNYWRNSPTPPQGTAPVVYIASAPSCAHTALTVGKWLHSSCFNGACPNAVAGSTDAQGNLAYCIDPTSSAGWNARCVAKAQTIYACHAPHSECDVGPAIPKWSSGCSAEVCNDSRYTSCCDTTNGSWTSTCATAANTLCTGGQERTTIFGNYGFCGSSVVGAAP